MKQTSVVSLSHPDRPLLPDHQGHCSAVADGGEDVKVEDLLPRQGDLHSRSPLNLGGKDSAI